MVYTSGTGALDQIIADIWKKSKNLKLSHHHLFIYILLFFILTTWSSFHTYPWNIHWFHFSLIFVLWLQSFLSSVWNSFVCCMLDAILFHMSGQNISHDSSPQYTLFNHFWLFWSNFWHHQLVTLKICESGLVPPEVAFSKWIATSLKVYRRS